MVQHGEDAQHWDFLRSVTTIFNLQPMRWWAFIVFASNYAYRLVVARACSSWKNSSQSQKMTRSRSTRSLLHDKTHYTCIPCIKSLHFSRIFLSGHKLRPISPEASAAGSKHVIKLLQRHDPVLQRLWDGACREPMTPCYIMRHMISTRMKPKALHELTITPSLTNAAFSTHDSSSLAHRGLSGLRLF